MIIHLFQNVRFSEMRFPMMHDPCSETSFCITQSEALKTKKLILNKAEN